MTYLVWDGESLFEKDGSLIQVSEDECCCITTTGSTSGSTDTDTATGTGSTSDSGSSDSGGSGSSDTTGYPSGSGGSAECVEDSDCCVCNYKIEKEACSLEGCPEGWVDDGFHCVYMSEFYVNCSAGDCPPAPIDDLGDVECCEGWNDASPGGYDGSCSSFTEESGVCCNGECEEDCCDYREQPELCDSVSGTCTQYYTGSTGNCDYESRQAAEDGCESDGSTYPEYFCYTYSNDTYHDGDWCYEMGYRDPVDPPDDTFDSTATEAECSCPGADGYSPPPNASMTAQEVADEWCALYGYVWVASQGSCTNDNCPEEQQVYDETTGETYCCPEGCPPDQEYHSDGSGYGDADGPCCCENPSQCQCYCDCSGSFPCTEAEGGGQAACEAIGPNCYFTSESSPGAGDCGCDCSFIPNDFASVDDDCGTDNADVDSICGPASECLTGGWGLSCEDLDYD